jgi:hypothetical protein
VHGAPCGTRIEIGQEDNGAAERVGDETEIGEWRQAGERLPAGLPD